MEINRENDAEIERPDPDNDPTGLKKCIQERDAVLALRARQYHELFVNIRDAVYLADPHGHLVAANPAALALFDYTSEDIPGKNIAELFVQTRAYFEFLELIDATGIVYDHEVRLRKRNGAEMECLVTASARRSPDGGLIGYQAIVRDVTPRKMAERKIDEQTAFLKTVIDSLTAPFLVVDAATYGITIANAAARMAGKANTQSCHILFHGLDRPCGETGHECPVDRVKQTRRSTRVEHVHPDTEGRIRNCEIHGFPLFGANRQVSEVILYHLDITERVRTKRALQRLGTAIEQTADSIIIADQEGRILYVNPSFEAATGYSRDEVMGRRPSILELKGENRGVQKAIWETIRKGDVWKGNFLNRRKDATVFEEETTISPVKSETGDVFNYVVIARDVTKRKRLESIAEAANLMENLGYFFSGIRHEIGNPINSIKMTQTVLKRNIDGYSKNRVIEFVDRTLMEILRVEYLLKALRNFSMFETPDVQRTRIDQFMRKFESLVRKDFSKKGIHIRLSIPPEVQWAYTDPRALHQVLLNLLTNATDALKTAEHPEISITLRAVSGSVQICVCDNGCGMSEKEQKELFKPFYTTKANGTGLGLVIVRKMLSKMEASIQIQSHPGAGTTAIISIPTGRSCL